MNVVDIMNIMNSMKIGYIMDIMNIMNIIIDNDFQAIVCPARIVLTDPV